MQLTRVLYRGLIRAAVSIFIVLLVLANTSILWLGKISQQNQVESQFRYLEQSPDLFVETSEPKRLTDIVLAWRIEDEGGQVVTGNRFAHSWNMSETQYPYLDGSLIISHQSLLASELKHLVVVNLSLIFIALIGLGVTHQRMFKHWKVLIQLEAWASRFSRNEKFKFFLKTRDYHLVNSIRELNSMRLEAQKGGQKVDHFIRSNTFLDKTTGLGNRLYFEHRLESLLQQEDSPYGAVLIIQYKVLEELRESDGKEAMTDLLQHYAVILKEYLDDTSQSVVSRISATDFAILFPYIDEKEVERVALNILRMSQKVPTPSYVDNSATCHIGADIFDHQDSSFQIMAEADMALRAAQLHGPSGWFMYDSGQLPQSDIKGSVRWRSTIENAISKQKFALLYQAVVQHDMEIHHHEVLIRMADDRGELVSAKVFLPMARKCGLIPEVDKQVLILMADTLTKNQSNTVSVNIHIDSWLNREFGNWLIRFLKVNVDIADKIIFEVSEFELAKHAKKLSSIVAAVKRLKARVMVDQVGLYVVDTEYLNHVRVDFLKLHQSIVNHIAIRPENQMFVRSLQGALTSQELSIFAMGVESEQEVSVLNRLGIEGMQGHYIKEPEIELHATKGVSQFDGDRQVL